MKHFILWFWIGIGVGSGIVGCQAFKEEKVTVPPDAALQVEGLSLTDAVKKLTEILGTTVKDLKEENGRLVATLPSLVSEVMSKAGTAAVTAAAKNPSKGGIPSIIWDSVVAAMLAVRVRNDIKERSNAGKQK